MNLVGRIFIILILLMSVTFMAFSLMVYSTSNNWREAAKKTKEELDAAKKQVASLTAQQTQIRETCDKELAARGEEIAKLLTAGTTLKQELDSSNAEKLRLESEIAQAISTVQVTHREMEASRGELDSLQAELRKSQTNWNTLFTDFVKKTDEAHQLSLQLTNLEAVSQELVKQYNDARSVLKQFGLKPVPELYAGVPPYQVDGRIREVRQTGGMVEITIGEDTGLMKGHQLDVYRKAEGRDIYLGVIEVVLTEPNKAACKILPEYRKGTIQVNDIVTSAYSQERQKYQLQNNHVATSL